MVTTTELLAALRDVELPFDQRRSVRRSDAHRKLGFCLGYVIQYDRGWTASKFTVKSPELSRLLCRFARERFPDFRFSSIMVNQGASALHVDKGNCGPSLIISLGDHVGGELWQYPGTVLNVKGKLKACDGRLPHITLPFRGERYSIVYFNMKGERMGPTPEKRALLRSCGFNKPPLANSDHSARTELLPEAAQILRKRWGLPQSYIGDYTNRSLKRVIRMSGSPKKA